jgi:hypothetical protein
MGPMEVVIEELQTHERIEGGIAEGFGVGLARESIEPIAQGPVESFNMHGASWLYRRPQRGADLHRQQSSVLTAYSIRVSLCPLFFCTNDQNSSIFTWLRCRSLASTCVRASPWKAARLSQTLIARMYVP